MKVFRRILLATCLLLACNCYAVTHPSPNNYSYTATTLLNIANIDDNAWTITPPFSIVFQNTTYSNFFVSSNSFINFGSISMARSNLPSSVFQPKILIEGRDNVAVSLIVRSTSANVTVYYKGYNYMTSSSRYIEWILTFYNSPFEKFDIDILSNTLVLKGTGDSYICTSNNCYQSIDTSTVQLSRYWGCPSGTCVNPGAQVCEATSFSNCDMCNYTGSTQSSCASCVYGYAVDYVNRNCVVCNTSTQHQFYGVCYNNIANCLSYDPTNPAVCSICWTGYAGPTCSICIISYFEYKPGFCGPNTSNCLEYNPGTYQCKTCSQQLAPPNCTSCSAGSYSNGSGCVACANGCGYCSQSTCISCTDGSKLNCAKVSSTVAIIIGVVIGVIGLLGIITGVIICVIMKKRRERLQRIQNFGREQDMPSQFVFFGRNLVYPQYPQSEEIGPPDIPMKEYIVMLEICSICLEPHPNIVTYCSHAFHLACLQTWYLKDQKCPNCNYRNTKFYAKCSQCNRYTIGTKLRSNSPTICKECIANPSPPPPVAPIGSNKNNSRRTIYEALPYPLACEVPLPSFSGEDPSLIII